ncbi:hypothetical protein HMPREF1153_0813 [Selenomonas sp. CM52]|nr:hypothetical protein HMPREF1153_0813 [Selenomonas sp. CM52]
MLSFSESPKEPPPRSDALQTDVVATHVIFCYTGMAEILKKLF